MLALALMQLACAAARERRHGRIKRLAKRLLLARSFTSWRRGANWRSHSTRQYRRSNHASLRLAAIAPLLTARRSQLAWGWARWARHGVAARKRAELLAWFDSQRFSAMGAALDRWRDGWALQRRRKLNATADVRALLWM